MRKKLKIYGGNTHLFGRQERTVAAVTSQKEFAALIHANVGYVRDYCCETGNQEEIDTAFKYVGKAWVQCKCCGHWRMYEERS